MKQLVAIFISAQCIAALFSCSNHSKKNDIPDPEPPIVIDTPLVKLGAYYFGGWYQNSTHITPSLVNDFPERQPVWGWETNTADAMKAQIDAAADAGLYFFSFCWYFNTQDLSENRPADDAIRLFANAPNKKRLKFCLLVANHDGYRINPQNWPALKEHWKKWFLDSSYLKVDGKPLIIFFDPSNLITNFGGGQNLKTAFDDLRNETKVLGLNGVCIGGCTSRSANSIATAKNAGFDVFTGYNYSGAGLTTAIPTPISNMVSVETNTCWPIFANAGALYIPISTLNWDNRPWVVTNRPDTVKRFAGFSKQSVTNSISNLKTWILNNPSSTTKEKLGLVYAWNEYGEGGWLTPSTILKDSLLQGFKVGLK